MSIWTKLYSCAQSQVLWYPEVDLVPPHCMALGLTGALEGLAAQNRPLSEEAQASTSLTGQHWGVVCMLKCASEAWTAQMWLLEWAKDILQGSASQMGPMQRASSCVMGGKSWGSLLGNTAHLGGGFAWVFPLSVAVFSDLCCCMFWLNRVLLQ